jgi:hypothetical protein
MKKVCLLVCISIFFLGQIFSFSKRIETLSVINYSAMTVSIEAEFNAGVATQEENYFLTETIRDLTLEVKDRVRNYKTITPYNRADLHECFPLSSTLGNDNLYERMLELPFMEKITAIYKKLIIKKEDGSIVLTLDTLGDKIIKKKVLRGETVYYIEIFDYDLEGKPASEW